MDYLQLALYHLIISKKIFFILGKLIKIVMGIMFFLHESFTCE